MANLRSPALRLVAQQGGPGLLNTKHDMQHQPSFQRCTQSWHYSADPGQAHLLGWARCRRAGEFAAASAAAGPRHRATRHCRRPRMPRHCSAPAAHPTPLGRHQRVWFQAGAARRRSPFRPPSGGLLLLLLPLVLLLLSAGQPLPLPPAVLRLRDLLPQRSATPPPGHWGPRQAARSAWVPPAQPPQRRQRQQPPGPAGPHLSLSERAGPRCCSGCSRAPPASCRSSPTAPTASAGQRRVPALWPRGCPAAAARGPARLRELAQQPCPPSPPLQRPWPCPATGARHPCCATGGPPVPALPPRQRGPWACRRTCCPVSWAPHPLARHCRGSRRARSPAARQGGPAR